MDSSAVGDPLLADPGTPFDPAAEQPAGPELPPREPVDQAAGELDVAWTTEGVRTKLEFQGHTLHRLVGAAEADWIYTELELRAIAPPLARILNRYPTTRLAAGVSDELDVALGMFGYAARSIGERKAALAAREVPNASEPPRGAPTPAPGVGAPEGPAPTDPLEDLEQLETPDM